MKTVVCDTSPITNLIAIGHIQILHHLFKEVYIPPAVEAELKKSHPQIPEFIKTIPIQSKSYKIDGLNNLDNGESEAIILAIELGKPTLLIIDERKGHNVAEDAGISCTGLLGILIQARKIGLIDNISAILSELKSNGFYLTKSVELRVLEIANESY